MRRVCAAEEWETLEETLAIEVRRARASDPLRAIDLLVGSNLLGLYLRRLLARRLGAIAAVRPLTFLDLARRVAEPSLLASGLRPLPPLGDELLVGRAVADLPPDGYFEPVRALEGFRGALLASIRDLKDAGWTPAHLAASIEEARMSGEALRKLIQTLRIYRSYEEALRAARLYDRSDLLARAAALSGTAPSGPEAEAGPSSPLPDVPPLPGAPDASTGGFRPDPASP